MFSTFPRQRRFRLGAAACLITCAAHAQSSLDVSSGLNTMVDRYLTAAAAGQWEARARSVAAIRTPAEVKARQEYIRGRLVEEIGGWPGKTPLNPRITGTLDRPGYRIEKLIFESQPRYYVTANVYVPTAGQPPFPAVLGTAGHSGDGKAYEVYQHVWANLARRGFVVLAYDPPGQGERLEYLDPATGKSPFPPGGTAEHTMEGIQCLLTGTNVARYFVWDGIRAFDYLLTRPDVDPKRIAVAGNSGGGTQSAYLAALEPRLAAAAPSCYLTSWEKLWSGQGPQDAEQVFVNFLADGLDFPDFLIAFAPKPIQMGTATRDFFPIEGARATFAEARRIFSVLGAEDHAGFFEFDDPHGWSKPRREATYRWFARWLEDRPGDGDAEPAFTPEPPADLRCTATGQVATSIPGAETVQSLNAALAERLHANRPGAGGKNIPALVRARLRVAPNRGAPPAEKRGEVDRDGYRIEKIELRPEPGIIVPALAFVPAGGSRRKPAVIYLNSAGKAADAEEDGPIEALVRSGSLVLAIDPRGSGESAPASTQGVYSKAYQTTMRAFLAGKTIPGMQTGDVLRSFDYLASRPDVDRGRISLYGIGKGAVTALFAGVLEPGIQSVRVDRAPETYLSIAHRQMHQDIQDLIVPGVLRDFDLPDVIQALGRRYVAGEPPQVRAAAARSQVRFTRQPDKILVEIDGKPYTAFFLAPGGNKPYVYPLSTPSGLVVTRHFPMEDFPGEIRDHPHQRGLFFSHGDINGYNFWATEPGQDPPRQGRMVLKSPPETRDGAASGTVRAVFDGLDPRGNPIMTETRTLTFHAGPGPRIIDYEIRVEALGRLTFADTKEGTFGIRLATSMTEQKGGRMVNAGGAETEKNVWGKRSAWVDYYGPVDGRTAGVAIFDHPANPRHPAYWHSRAYGLMAANIFGVRDFTGDKSRDGSMTLQPGESVTFRYRVLIHDGDARSAGIAELYRKYEGAARH